MRNGFTLIELLAVIVILAIIALITIPIVTNTINNSEKESTEISLASYAKVVKNAKYLYELNNGVIVNGVFTTTDGKTLTNGNITLTADSKGNKIVCNTIEIYSNDSVYLDECSINNSDKKYTYGTYKTVPDLYDGTLTPVIYKNNKWVIANVSEEWYNYEKQQWANAVILDNNVYKKAGDTLDISSEVLAMFVWIPRYEYKYTNLGTNYAGGTQTEPGEIEINLISKNRTKATSSEYKVHPAFTFGTVELSGMWVGKFETSHTEGSSYNSLGCSTETCANSSGLRILPNVMSLKYNDVSNFFFAIKSMNMEDNVFRIDSKLTDTHMIKNSEWGAIAYLSQSKYGKYGNGDYTGVNKEIYINNSLSGYTGKSGGAPSATSVENGPYSYDEEINGTGASTTGNIYGIYDMSGGAMELVMGVFANSQGTLWSGSTETVNSGFTGLLGSDGGSYTGVSFPELKYYDVYKASNGMTISSATACNGEVCYGHALSETSAWYSDISDFVSASWPWFIRGGSYVDIHSAGVFNNRTYSGYSGLGPGGTYPYTSRAVFVRTS